MTKKLFEILPLEFNVAIKGDAESCEISDITIDSRSVQKGSLYVALVGTKTDGHSFIGSAIKQGAIAILCEEFPETLDSRIVYVKSSQVREVLGQMMHQFYDRPSESLTLIGVTGTNGKTTVSTLLYQLFSKLGHICGLISTVEVKIGDEILESTHTTPDVVNLHKLIAKMRDAKCKYVFMEVSSHAIDQKRIQGLHFEIGLFTNISHDHLDYHHTMLEYINAKKAFFDALDSDSMVITNIDDRNGEVMVQNTKAKKYTYTLTNIADFRTKIIEDTLDGLHLKINGKEASFRMIGSFNAYNLTLVYATAELLGVTPDEILANLSTLRGAEGRFDQVIGSISRKYGIVDYAHTPDALLNVLKTIHHIKPNSARIVTVVGCGGDRDKTKRPEMARIAAIYSDHTMLTSDNPRNEKPENIIEDMEKGIPEEKAQNVLVMLDRRAAIHTASLIAREGDIILVAGKGHEKYQEIKGKKFPFDDKKILESFLG
ncbi:MAG: UDP-N-acetylmuramoyl-L-alanyl-D-glutamate--2,6-diaminopimelate ligase [Saprospiraceae bacterium]